MNATMPQPTCSSCPYWVHIDMGEGYQDDGECHEGPPELDRTGAGGIVSPHVSVWRPTPGSEFCGRHPGFPAWLAWRALHGPGPAGGA